MIACLQMRQEGYRAGRKARRRDKRAIAAFKFRHRVLKGKGGRCAASPIGDSYVARMECIDGGIEDR